MSILLNKTRVGNFTSSQIYRLVEGTRGLTEKQELELHQLKDRHAMAEQGEGKVLTEKMLARRDELQNTKDNPGPTKPQLTYIEEKQIENRLGRSLGMEKTTRAMTWGNFMEQFVFENFTGLGYQITSNETATHPTINGWSGSTDLIQPGVKVADIKCFEPKKFALYSDALMLGDINNLRKNFAAEYWQLVSNAIINGTPNAEAIVFMPYQSELAAIREFAANDQSDDQYKFRFIYEGSDIELPYLPEGGYYKNLNTFEFEIPQEDITLLTEIVEQSIELLNGPTI